MAIINMNNIKRKIAVSPGVIRKTNAVLRKRFEAAEAAYMKEFENSKITQELEGGVQSGNSSGTLGSYGNLFTFMGFSSGSKPISTLRRVLKAGFKMSKGKVSRTKLRTYVFSFPGVDYLRRNTSTLYMPFERGRNWVLAIEQGISGFSFYMNKKWKGDGARSGHGVQIENKISQGRGTSTFKRTRYRTIFEKAFTDKIKEKKNRA